MTVFDVVRTGFALYLILMAGAIGAGCSGSKVTAKSSAELSRYVVNSIVLVPFRSIATPQMRDQIDPILSPPQGIHRSDASESSSDPSVLRQTTTVPPFAAEKITQLFWNRLQQRSTLRVVSGSEAMKELTEESRLRTFEDMGAAIAKRMKVDAALIGEVTVYQERVGSRLGASPPASVGFEAKMVAPDGQLLWTGSYYERQRPMNEDMLGALQRWGAFVTAEELAQYGVEKVLKKFPF